jgi:hypothetical protein
MKFLTSAVFSKILIILTSIAVAWLFFYFESSLMLQILSVLLIISGLFSINKNPEIIVLSLIYLISNDLYNLRYGLSIPLPIIMIIIWAFTVFLGYFYLKQLKSLAFASRDYLFSYLLVWSLAILEIFLIMSFWPIDPKTKSLIITVSFFLIGKTIYFNVNNVLSLKRISSFLIVSIVALAIVFALTFLGL